MSSGGKGLKNQSCKCLLCEILFRIFDCAFFVKSCLVFLSIFMEIVFLFFLNLENFWDSFINIRIIHSTEY